MSSHYLIVHNTLNFFIIKLLKNVQLKSGENESSRAGRQNQDVVRGQVDRGPLLIDPTCTVNESLVVLTQTCEKALMRHIMVQSPLKIKNETPCRIQSSTLTAIGHNISRYLDQHQKHTHQKGQCRNLRMNHRTILKIQQRRLDNLAHLHSPGREDGSLLMGHDLVTVNPKNI